MTVTVEVIIGVVGCVGGFVTWILKLSDRITRNETKIEHLETMRKEMLESVGRLGASLRRGRSNSNKQ